MPDPCCLMKNGPHAGRPRSSAKRGSALAVDRAQRVALHVHALATLGTVDWRTVRIEPSAMRTRTS